MSISSPIRLLTLWHQDYLSYGSKVINLVSVAAIIKYFLNASDWTYHGCTSNDKFLVRLYKRSTFANNNQIYNQSGDFCRVFGTLNWTPWLLFQRPKKRVCQNRHILFSYQIQFGSLFMQPFPASAILKTPNSFHKLFLSVCFSYKFGQGVA